MKTNVAIVSTGVYWESIQAAIDFDDINICAFYDFAAPIEMFRDVYHSLDMLPITCKTCDAEFWLVNFENPGLDDTICAKLTANGVRADHIIRLPWFGTQPQFNYMYFLQWQILRQIKNVDFFVTGLSYIEYGIDLQSLQPFRGVSFARQSQDLYYGFKMAEAFLNEHIKNNDYRSCKIKFCLIGLAPYIFNHWLDKTNFKYNELYYFPIIGHDQMEYKGSDHGRFLASIFKHRYKEWFNRHVQNFIGKKINLNDIDWSRGWHQEHCFVRPTHYLTIADTLSVYTNRYYEETKAKNIKILHQYINMCRHHDILPIGVLLPFTEVGRCHYPAKSLDDFYATLEQFRDDMPIIDLWDYNLSDKFFEDCTHLKMSGAMEVTQIIREKITALIK